MKSFKTKIKDFLRNCFLILDYIVWLTLDFSKFKYIKKGEIKKVLIIHTGALGELLVATPIIPLLKNTLNCKVDLMLGKGKDVVFKNNPHVNKIFFYCESFKKNKEILKKEKYDLALILYPGEFKLSLLCFLSKIKYRIGCFRKIELLPSLFFTRRVFPINKKHAVQKNLDMIKSLISEKRKTKMEIYLSKKEKDSALRILRELKVKKFIIVHPGFAFSNTKYPSRLWPLKRYAFLIDQLLEKYDMKILLTGSPEEELLCKKIKSLSKNREKVIVTNKLFGLREFIALIKKANLVICPSTSTAHFSAAIGTPLVNLMGRENKYEWVPWGENDKINTLFHPEVCTECNENYCRKRNIECMGAISVKEVLDASKELLEKD